MGFAFKIRFCRVRQESASTDANAHAQTAELLKIWNVWAPATYETSEIGVG